MKAFLENIYFPIFEIKVKWANVSIVQLETRSVEMKRNLRLIFWIFSPHTESPSATSLTYGHRTVLKILSHEQLTTLHHLYHYEKGGLLTGIWVSIHEKNMGIIIPVYKIRKPLQKLTWFSRQHCKWVTEEGLELVLSIPSPIVGKDEW